MGLSKLCADVSDVIFGEFQRADMAKVYEEFPLVRDQYNPLAGEATLS